MVSFAWTSSALGQCSLCSFLSWLLIKFSLSFNSHNWMHMHALHIMLFSFFEWRNEMHDHFNEVGSVCECGVPILKIKVLMVMDFVNTFYILPTNLVYILNQELSLLLWEYPWKSCQQKIFYFYWSWKLQTYVIHRIIIYENEFKVYY